MPVFAESLPYTYPPQTVLVEPSQAILESPRAIHNPPQAILKSPRTIQKSPRALTQPRETPKLAIVIDDLGYSRSRGLQAINLPGPMTVAVMPHTPNARLLAEAAHAAGKEVILHHPMQGSNYHPGATGIMTGTLTLAMGREEISGALAAAFASVPHCVGMNNHTGSTLTAAPAHMHWLMQDLATRGHYYLDSRTTAQTVAGEAADAWGIPFVSRDVFLDHKYTASALEYEFDRALDIARRAGNVVLIAHPLPLSLALLERRLAQLSPEEFQLVHASDLLNTPVQWAPGGVLAGEE